MWLVHVYAFYVYFFLFVTAALRDLDASLLEASADLGASGWRAFRRVVLPLLRPALVGASLLVFMLSMASFTAPLIFAGTEPFLTVQIYNHKRRPRPLGRRLHRADGDLSPLPLPARSATGA